MWSIEARSADEAWRQAARVLLRSGSRQPSRQGLTKEVLGVAMSLTEPQDRLVWSRPMNPAFAIAETIWVLSGSNQPSFVEFWNPRMRRYVDPRTRVLHGAYGARLGVRPRLSSNATAQLRPENGNARRESDQLRNAETVLRRDPTSRQVVLQIWESDRDFPNPRPRSPDIPCNIVSHLLVRNNRLEWLQVMRSNDVVWGLPYNLFQWTVIQETLAGWLGLETGKFTLVVDSLHVYKPFWKPLEKWVSTAHRARAPRPELLGSMDRSEWEHAFFHLVDATLGLMTQITPARIRSILPITKTLPESFAKWHMVLAAEALRRHGFERDAKKVVLEAGPYLSGSWLAWADSQRKA
jgi:thymidylate synthase